MAGLAKDPSQAVKARLLPQLGQCPDVAQGTGRLESHLRRRRFSGARPLAWSNPLMAESNPPASLSARPSVATVRFLTRPASSRKDATSWRYWRPPQVASFTCMPPRYDAPIACQRSDCRTKTCHHTHFPKNPLKRPSGIGSPLRVGRFRSRTVEARVALQTQSEISPGIAHLPSRL